MILSAICGCLTLLLLPGVLISRSSFLDVPIASLFSSSISPSGLNVPPFSSLEEEQDLGKPKETTKIMWRRRQQANRIRSEIDQLVYKDPSLAGPLIRLAFHDATTLDATMDSSIPNQKSSEQADTFQGGSNGSIRFELDRSENRGLGRPMQVVLNLFSALDPSDPVSLADIIALAGAQAVETVGGPRIPIRLGRLDANQADAEYLQQPMQKSTSRSLVEKTLPLAGLDSDGLRLYFVVHLGLSEAEFVALSGSHGLGRHVSLLGMPRGCLKNLTRSCLEDAPVLLPFVRKSVDTFDNSYFHALLQWNKGGQVLKMGEVAFLPTDVAMVVDDGLRKHVERFARHPNEYRQVFARAYQKLVDVTATTTDHRY